MEVERYLDVFDNDTQENFLETLTGKSIILRKKI